MHFKNNYGVTEIIGLILIFTIISIIVTLTLVWSVDYMERARYEAQIESVINQFDTMDEAIRDLINQGNGSSRTVNFVKDEGYLQFSSSGTRFVIWHSVNRSFFFNVSGFDITKLDYDPYNFGINQTRYNGSSRHENFDDPRLNGKLDYYINITFLDNGVKESFKIERYGGVDTGFHNDDNRKGYGDPSGDASNWHRNVTLPGVGTTNLLEGAFRIDIVSVIDPDKILGNSDDTGFDCIGRIWVFDVGYIACKSSTSSTSHTAYLENGGIVSIRDYSRTMVDIPKIDIDYKGLVLRIIQIKPDSNLTIGSAKGKYKLTLNFTNSVEENRFYSMKYQNFSFMPDGNPEIWGFRDQTPYSKWNNFKFQVFGDHADAWINYLNFTYNDVFFSQHYRPDGNNIFYFRPTMSFFFTLIYSTIDVNLKVIQ